MKVSVLQENLQKALAAASRAVDSRPTLPVLANVLIATEDSRLRISATNLEMSITTWIGAKINEPGSITLPAKTFSELVNNLSPERVDMVLDVATQTVNVRCGATNSNIKGIDASEFPMVPTGGEPDFSVPSRVLKEMVKHTEFASAKDDNRPILTGIYTSIENNLLTMAAADGYRLAVRTTQLETTITPKKELVIPSKALSEVARLITEEDDQVMVTLPGERDLVMFQTRNSEISTQLLEGRFPNFRDIIPRGYSTITTIETQDLLRAAKRAEIFARDEANSAVLMINPPEAPGESGEMQIIGRSKERGDLDGILHPTIEGQAIEITFNVKYLIDVLSVIQEDMVQIESNGAQNPGVVRPQGRDDFVHVIMPMKPPTR
ncbi:MAG: DNA polymerase III subunit beta [Phototrophicaceae bacterium]